MRRALRLSDIAASGDQGLMTAMNTVEVTNCGNAAFAFVGYPIMAPNDPHRRSPSTINNRSPICALNLRARRYQQKGLALNDHGIADHADRVEATAALLMLDLNDQGARGHSVTGPDRSGKAQ